MRRANWHVGEHSRSRHNSFFADLESDLAFQDIEALFLLAVNVRWWPAARRHDGFPHGVLAARVLAGHQESIYVSHDADGAAFVRFGGLFMVVLFSSGSLVAADWMRFRPRNPPLWLTR